MLQGDFRKITAPHIAENRLQRGTAQLTAEQRPLEHAGESLFGAPAFTGNRLELASDTLAMLKRIAADIEGAKRSVLVEFYIWNEGGLTREVVDALIACRGPWRQVPRAHRCHGGWQLVERCRA